MAKTITDYYNEAPLTSPTGTEKFIVDDGSTTKGVLLSTLSTYIASSVSASIPDGDKGDITTSASGATWTIDNNAVTTAKINDGAVTAAKIAVGAVTDEDASLANKPLCRMVYTTNLATISGLSANDGYTPVAGDVILLTAQTTASQNGAWVAAAGAWTRPAWFPNGGTTQAFENALFYVTNGTTNADTAWRITTTGAITIGTTNIALAQIGVAPSTYMNLAGTQTVSGAKTFSNAALNHTGTTPNIGSSTGAVVATFGGGATLNATTKTVNICTGGVSGSINNTNIGSATAGALGTIALNSPLVNMLGGQLQFPATQIASAGANTLDDYEEGTWTPAVAFGGASVGVTYTTQVGHYIKIGQFVTLWARIVLSSKGTSTGTATVTGFPFTTNSTANWSAGGRVTLGQNFTTVQPEVARTTENTTLAAILAGGANTYAGLNDTNFNNNSVLEFQVRYRATA